MSVPFAGILEVVPEDVRRFGAALGAGAADIAGFTVGPEFEGAAASLAGADTSAVLAQAPGRAKSVFDAVSGRLRGLSAVAAQNADDYESADAWLGELGQS